MKLCHFYGYTLAQVRAMSLYDVADLNEYMVEYEKAVAEASRA